jgi:hypothetical protein
VAATDDVWTRFCGDVVENERDDVLQLIEEAANHYYMGDTPFDAMVKITEVERRNALNITASGVVLVHGVVYSFSIASGNSNGFELLAWDYEYVQPLF